jgi:DNA (cytosine-5)-methyltransferase 1
VIKPKRHQANSKLLQSVEIFAGGGGMALGMREAGFTHHALVEWWAPAARVLRHNAELRPELWKPNQVLEQDVCQVGDALGEPGTIQLVAGGPPCQPFSLAGAHAGDNDRRNMFPAAIDVVRRLTPQLVVFENVPGLTRPSFAPYLDYVKDQLRRPHVTPRDNETWDDHHARILKSKCRETYRVYQHDIDAADIGVPQCRRRVFFIAIRSDVTNADTWPGIERTHSRDALLDQQWVTGEYWIRHSLPMPNEIPARLRGQVARIRKTGGPTDHAPWVTLRDALANIPDPIAEAPSKWPNHVVIPGARAYAKHTGSPLDLPSKAIKAGVHGVAGGEAMLRELDGTVRYLTIREAAIIQGFPREYEFPGFRSRVMGVIGNAVAVKVAASLGDALRRHCLL